MGRRADTAVDKLKCYVTPETLAEEKRKYFKRYYVDDRVRLRGSDFRGIGTVRRTAITDEGGLIIEWDDFPGLLSLHNPRFIETVWLDPKGEEI